MQKYLKRDTIMREKEGVTKICPTCVNLKPLTSEYFYRNKSKKNGYSENCKKCLEKLARGYRENYKKKNMEVRTKLIDKITLKKCGGCKETKAITNFNKNPSDKYGYASYCKKCCSKANKRYNIKKQHLKEDAAFLITKKTERGKTIMDNVKTELTPEILEESAKLIESEMEKIKETVEQLNGFYKLMGNSKRIDEDVIFQFEQTPHRYREYAKVMRNMRVFNDCTEADVIVSRILNCVLNERQKLKKMQQEQIEEV